MKNVPIGLGKTATAFALTAALALLAGCGNHAPATSAQAFDNADAKIKDLWTQAGQADKNNDYVTAITEYKQILAAGSSLTPEQNSTAEDALGKINQRLVAASMNGDPSARQALSTLATQMHQRTSH